MKKWIIKNKKNEYAISNIRYDMSKNIYDAFLFKTKTEASNHATRYDEKVVPVKITIKEIK